jgi:hypothetical protein
MAAAALSSAATMLKTKRFGVNGVLGSGARAVTWPLTGAGAGTTAAA